MFHLFLLSLIVIVPSIFFGYPLLGAFGYEKYANHSVIIGSITHLIGLGFLIIFKSINIYTVTVMVFLTETIVLVARVFFARKFKII